MENTGLSLSEVLHGNWVLEQEEIVRSLEAPIVENVGNEEGDETIQKEKEEKPKEVQEDPGDSKELQDLRQPSKTLQIERVLASPVSQEKRVFISPPYVSPNSSCTTSKASAITQQLYHPGYTAGHAYPVSSTYHQPYVPMVRNKKTSALANALQQSVPMFPPAPAYHPHLAYMSNYPLGYSQTPLHHLPTSSYRSPIEAVAELTENGNEVQMKHTVVTQDDDRQHHFSAENGKKDAHVASSSSTSSAGFRCGPHPTTTNSTFIRNRQSRCFDLPANVLDSGNADSSDEQTEPQGEQPTVEDEMVRDGEGAEKTEKAEERVIFDDNEKQEPEKSKAAEAAAAPDEDENIIVVDEREEATSLSSAPTATAVTEEGETTTTSSSLKNQPRSELELLLSQPVKKPVSQDYSSFVVLSTSQGTASSQSHSSKMQFYQAPAQQHLVRTTPPPGFAQPYGMGMRPHEEETRQIMNLDNQQTHSSSPTSSWNQPYVQMTNLNTYQPRGPPLYAPPAPSMVHQSGPPGVVPTSNPYYQAPPGPPHHHMQPPQAPMMAPVMHAQQQPPQPYYNTQQSPLTGTPPSMSYGNSQMPAPQASNGNAPIFNFTKPRNSNDGSSGSGGHRRKKQNDLSSPRYNNNNSDDVDGGVFPDMADFPLLDVVQSKAKKDAGRKPCRPHLCEQSRMLISRVCHFHREFVKRLPSRHPLANSPFSKPDQWTSQIMGISLATVRKCVDMAVEEEVFTRCTDKNLVNLTFQPSERAEREELLSKLSTVFEDEKTLGAGTAGLTIAEYSPRRSYSNTLMRQSTDDKSSSSSYNLNGAEYGSSETTLLNLDDHSNSSKDFGTTPTPSMELSNGHLYEEIGTMNGGQHEPAEKEPIAVKVETPKRGRPRKTPGTATNKPNKRKESNEDSEVAEDKDEHEKKTEDEDETNEETEKKTEEVQQLVLVEREDDAASSEGTNRSETATPEPTALSASIATSKKTRATRRKKRSSAGLDEDYTVTTTTVTKKKRGSVTVATAGLGAAHNLDDENAEHKMVTRARSRQP